MDRPVTASDLEELLTYQHLLPRLPRLYQHEQRQQMTADDPGLPNRQPPYPYPQPPPSGHVQQQQQYDPPTRTGPMRLDLPLPPVFTTQPPSDVDYPNQYGPPSGGFVYQGQAQPSPNHMPPPHTHPGPSHLYPPASDMHDGKPYPPSMPTSPYGEPGQPSLEQQQQQQMAYMAQQPQLSPYYTPYSAPMVTASSNGSNGSAHINEYFPPYAQGTPVQPPAAQVHSGRPPQISPPFTSPTWMQQQQQQQEAGPSHLGAPQTAIRPDPMSSATGSSQSGGSGNTHGPKTSRQQFTACGACRHRRVKCDLKDRQEEAERRAAEDEHAGGPGPVRSSSTTRQKRVSCTNCQERGMNCVDEFAPMKAAKQLRRGKRISEIEMLYGKQAVGNRKSKGAAAAAALPSGTGAPSGPGLLPELSPEFFESAFFRRFQVQRPLLDPKDFVNRYLSFAEPCAANLGPEGAMLCHVLYAWAVSYGVDEHGRLDIPEGGGTSGSPISLLEPGKDEIKREDDRQTRFAKMRSAVEVILDEIDSCGVLRKPTWDGVRVLLLLLPLTEGISSQVERIAMYESALSQVFMLCSYEAMGYDGRAAGTSSVNGGSDTGDGRDLNIVRIRTYWYAFVHEGITAGLKGNRLLLDGDDLETIQDSISNRTLVSSSTSFRSASKMAVAPINLALACRLINRALTGPNARRRNAVNPEHVKEAWEALEGCWEEFESIRDIPPGEYSSHDEIIRFVDGWKIFLFEAQNVIRTNLEERLGKLSAAQSTAYISDPSNTSQKDDLDSNILTVIHLLEIAKSKCEVKTRQIMAIVRQHVGTRFFEWDASLVRDGTFYAAMLLAKTHGSDDDIAVCVQALNELRWAHAKACSRSADLRREWATRSAHSSTEQMLPSWDGPPPALGMINTAPLHNLNTTPHSHSHSHPNSHGTNSSLSNSPYTSPSLISPIYDTAHMSLNGPPPPPVMADGTYWQASSTAGAGGGLLAPPPLQAHPPPQQQQHISPNTYAMMNHDHSTSAGGMDQYGMPQATTQHMGTYANVPDMGYVPDQQGRYVFQPDGSQMYVPCSHDQQ